MKKTLFGAALLCFAGLLSGCKTDYTPTTIDGFTQGTTFHIVIRDDLPKGVDIENDVDSIFRRVEESMSLYEPNSLLSRLNRNETDTIDRYIADCIRIAETLSRETGGLFDITVKPLTGAYGFAGEERTAAPNIDSLLRFVGYEKIRVEGNRLVKAHPNVQIDLNAIAQGYTVDLMAKHFDALGLKNYLVEMGGEIFSRGLNARDEKWVVGIDSPVEGNLTPGMEMQVMIHLSGRGLATSGNYRKFYENESGQKIVHTVNPKTGEPVVSRVLSATVVAPDATLADIYGTYFMVAGLEKTAEFLNRHPEVDAYVVFAGEDNRMQVMATHGLDIVEPER